MLAQFKKTVGARGFGLGPLDGGQSTSKGTVGGDSGSAGAGGGVASTSSKSTRSLSLASAALLLQRPERMKMTMTAR